MAYFSRRNEYTTEYSGHEEVSQALRDRLLLVISKYVDNNSMSYGDHAPYSVEPDDLIHETQKEFPNKNPFEIIKDGPFHEVFTVVEIFLDLTNEIYYTRKNESQIEISKAFQLSGSVYRSTQSNRIELKIDSDIAEKIDSVKEVLASYPEFLHRFFQAVGNLVGKKAKPEDVVKDIFVASEGYLKDITKTSRFGDAIKELFKKNLINKEQKKVLEALHEFRSDADGAGHAGNSITPTEETALWFLDTLVAQLRMIDKAIKQHE